MDATPISPAARLLQWWDRLKDKPGGRWLFARIIGFGIPYTGTVKPRVLVVEPGLARVEMRDRRRVRNHLSSVHALALSNVGELAGGLALTAGLDANTRSILTALHVEFKKKARGTVVAECRCEVPHVRDAMEHQVRAIIRDEAGDEVATVTSTWKLSPTWKAEVTSHAQNDLQAERPAGAR